VRRLLGARNRRRAPERKAVLSRGRLAGAGTAVLAVAVVCAAWPLLGTALHDHPYFALREVTVRGQRRVSADRIRQLAGIEPGMSVWSVDAAAAADRLRAEPWLRSAVVRRDLPHRAAIQVREHRPVAILAPEDGKGTLYYVAAHGSIFATVSAGDATDFPYLSGLRAADLEAGDAFGPQAVRRALGLLRATTRSPALGAVSEIVVDRTRGLTLLPVEPPIPIEVGWGGFTAKLARLAPVLREWKGRETEMAGVSLLFDDEVIVRRRLAGSPRKIGT
jgi:cell division protein FtsQ